MTDEQQKRVPPKRADHRARTRVILVIVVLLLLTATAGLGVVFVRIQQPAGKPAVQKPNDLVWVKSLYGFGPAKDEQLFEPTSVAIAPNGDIYATDPQRARVMRFTAEGRFRSLVHTGGGGTQAGMFVRPESIATDAAGNLYIADPVAGKVIVFDGADKFVREWPADHPKGVSVYGNEVYVLTTGRLSIYSRSGESLGAFGSRGRAEGEIDAYQGVVGDGTRVYVADALNSRVVAFDKSGRAQWTSPKPSPRASSATSETTPATDTVEPQRLWDLPQDIVMDNAGRLVVVDAFAFQLVTMDAPTGRVTGRYGDYGTEDGRFIYPTGLDYDPQRDWFAVADTRNNRVQIVRLPGSGETIPAATRRIVDSPWKYCALPLLLALLAMIVALLRRRGERGDRPGDVDPSQQLPVD